jgi:menaquinone-dependent protoporphyrinogen oxidase
MARLGFLEKLAARAARAPAGDFRDWDAIRAWARAIAGEVSASG